MKKMTMTPLPNEVGEDNGDDDDEDDDNYFDNGLEEIDP
jgi:hypothetical protein